MKICPKCNFEITNDAAKFCKNCGAKLMNETIATTTQPPIEEMPGEETFVEPITDESHFTDVVPIAPKPAEETPKFEPKHKYTPPINGFFAFVLCLIVIGGIGTAIIGLATIDVSSYYGSIFLLCSDISMAILTPVFAIYAVVSTYKRKSGSVTLLQSYLIIVLITKIVAIIGDSFFESLSTVILSTIWNIVFIVYIAYSEKVKEVFPKESRKTSKLDRAMIWAFILIPTLSLLLGILELILFS